MNFELLPEFVKDYLHLLLRKEHRKTYYTMRTLSLSKILFTPENKIEQLRRDRISIDLYEEYLDLVCEMIEDLFQSETFEVSSNFSAIIIKATPQFTSQEYSRIISQVRKSLLYPIEIIIEKVDLI